MKRLLLALLLATVLGLSLADWQPASTRRAGAGSCGLPLIMGDMNGTRVVAANDALWILRRNAGLIVSLPPCSPEDVDCDARVSSVDALKILRHVAALPVSQADPCIAIGGEIPP